MIYIVESDEHLQDKDRGLHKDYAKTSIEEFARTNKKAKELKKQGKKVGIIGLGDMTFQNFKSVKYRRKVEKLLEERKKITDNHYWNIKGNHDELSNDMSEYEFYEDKGYFRHEHFIEDNGIKIWLADYKDDLKEILGSEKHNGELNILLVHKHIMWKSSKMGYFGDKYKDFTLIDDNKIFEGLDWIICGHIHTPFIDKGKVSGGNTCKLVYQGCASRPNIDNQYEKVSWVLIDTDEQEVMQEFYDLPKLEDTFNLVKAEIDKTRSKVVIADILTKLDNYKLGDTDIVGIIKGIDTKKEYKEKAIEYYEKGRMK